MARRHPEIRVVLGNALVWHGTGQPLAAGGARPALPHLRMLGVSGSPLGLSTARWAKDAVGPHARIASMTAERRFPASPEFRRIKAGANFVARIARAELASASMQETWLRCASPVLHRAPASAQGRPGLCGNWLVGQALDAGEATEVPDAAR